MYKFADEISFNFLSGSVLIFSKNSPDHVRTSIYVYLIYLQLKNEQFDTQTFTDIGGKYNAPDAKNAFSLLLGCKIIVLDKVDLDNRHKDLNSLTNSLNVEYLTRSHNYPFLDYFTDGMSKDAHRMKEYYEAAKSEKRYFGFDFTAEPLAIDRNSSKNPRSVFKELKMFQKKSTKLKVEKAILACLGTSHYSRAMNNSTKRKFIPSGGARHPTVPALVDINRLEISFFDDDKNVFQSPKKINEPDYVAAFEVNHPNLDFKPDYAVFFFCHWEKNMFRYRECRTYRSVHMDAGHAIGALEHILSYLKTQTYVQYHVSDLALMQSLGIEEFELGFMGAIFVK